MELATDTTLPTPAPTPTIRIRTQNTTLACGSKRQSILHFNRTLNVLLCPVSASILDFHPRLAEHSIATLPLGHRRREPLTIHFSPLSRKTNLPLDLNLLQLAINPSQSITNFQSRNPSVPHNWPVQFRSPAHCLPPSQTTPISNQS